MKKKSNTPTTSDKETPGPSTMETPKKKTNFTAKKISRKDKDEQEGGKTTSPIILRNRTQWSEASNKLKEERANWSKVNLQYDRIKMHLSFKEDQTKTT